MKSRKDREAVTTRSRSPRVIPVPQESLKLRKKIRSEGLAGKVALKNLAFVR